MSRALPAWVRGRPARDPSSPGHRGAAAGAALLASLALAAACGGGGGSNGPVTGVPPAAPRVGATRFTPALTLTSDAIPVSGLTQAVFWWDRAQDGGGYDMRTGLPNTCVNRPVDYVIEASNDGGGSWRPVAAAAGNTYFTRAHLVDLTGANRVRMRITSVADLGSQYMFVEIQVHDARDGAADWWVFFGDSITSNVFSGADGVGTGRFGFNVHAVLPARWPIAHAGGVDGGRIPDLLQAYGGKTLFEQWLADFPGTYVSLSIGTNDINGYSDHAITADELDGLQAQFEQLVRHALAAGKKVIIPTLRWTNTNPYTGANIGAWNERLWGSVLPKYPGAIRGPDVYAPSKAQGTAGLNSDDTHLNDAGATLTQKNWTDWAVANVYQGH
jgi:hypothetical protein